jgi:hypothetical protein
LNVSQKSLRVANDGVKDENRHDWVEYRKAVQPEDKHDVDGWKQRKKKFVLKEEVDFKPQSTAHLMKWQSWDAKPKGYFFSGGI